MRLGTATLLVLAACTSTATPTGWMGRAPMETARSEHGAVAHEEEIVVVGGLVEDGAGRISATDTVEAYHPGTDRWRALPRLPEPRHHVMVAVVGSRLFVIGGFDENGFEAVDTVWELLGDLWVERTPLPEPVGAGAAVVLDGEVWVVGGVPGAGLHRYDPGADTWSTSSGPIVAREHLAAVVLNGEIWAIGGRWQGEVYATVEIFDPETGRWREGPLLEDARSGFGAATVGETVIVAGGEVFNPLMTLDSVEIHQAESEEWRPGESLPFGLHGNPLVAMGDTVFSPGGSTRAGGVDNGGEMLALDITDGDQSGAR